MGVQCARCGDRGLGRGEVLRRPAALPSTPAAARERKLATIVFADLVGSTELVEGQRSRGRPPDCSSRSSSSPAATFEEHGGRVEKFIGDAAMAVFGVPQVHGDDPDRAIAAALALDRAARRSAATDCELRIGIETGEVLVESGRSRPRGDGRGHQRRGASAAGGRSRRDAGRRARRRRLPASRARRPLGDLGQGIRGPFVAHAATGIDSATAGHAPRRSSVGARSSSACASAYLRTCASGAPPWR